VWCQFLTVALTTLCNIVLHVRLKQKILALPREVFFGGAPAPKDYTGPDLQDLRWAGSSSVVYAMYFPGIVFWHFFYASWMIVLALAALIGLVVIVFQPEPFRSSYAPHIWSWLVYALFFMSILLSHFLTRLFTSRCLLRQHSAGMDVRCLCLFSWYEVFFFLLSFALGPSAAFYDFLKGFFCTMIASLIVQKPNFTQFGELADYVYCTYCAALYLERVAEDSRRDDLLKSCDDPSNIVPSRSMSEPALADQLFTSKVACLTRTCLFWLLFLGFPFLTAVFINVASASLGYPCPKLVSIMPGVACHNGTAL